MSIQKLGNYIRQVDTRNTEKKISLLLGVSIEKQFIESIANTIGTDMSTYKIVRKGQFAYGPVTSRNGDKVSIALLEQEECIISSSYTVFEITDTEVLLPQYLMLWFRRPEFDRYARFHSHGSAREIFDWDELCNVLLPVPAIDEQKAIVKRYADIEHRITLKRKINDNLEIPFTLGSALFNNYTLFFEKSEPIARLNDDNALFFDLDKLPQDCVIRCRKTGDVITAFGNKTKSLKKYFTDKKIDARTSKHLPLIAKDNVVYAVLGVDISENVKIDKSSLNVIKFTYTKGE